MDYRDARKKSEWKAAFDKLVTIEMIEHVGKEFIGEFWAVADWALKDGSDGRAVAGVVQFISMPESSELIAVQTECRILRVIPQE